jgi:simple sugar transport system permease protein
MSTATTTRNAVATTDVLRRLRGPNNEGILALILVGLVVVTSVANPTFFSVPTMFAVLRNSIVPLIFALGVLIVIISGGIDVSFPAIAVFAAYSTVRAAEEFVDPGLLGAFAFALALGALLGLLNGVVIARFRLPTLIVTLGSQGIFLGVLLTYVGSRYVAELPGSLAALSKTNLLEVSSGGRGAFLHVMIVPAIGMCVFVSWLLRRTMFGRGVYAIGGDVEAARRAGFPVVRIQLFIYVLVGMMAATAGVIFMIMGRSASPRDMVGSELDIIAAVVLGGASIFGGRGSVLGTVLGVLVVQVIGSSLILAGVPSAWQRAAVGGLLLVGVGVQAVAARRSARHRRVVRTEEAVA